MVILLLSAAALLAIGCLGALTVRRRAREPHSPTERALADLLLAALAQRDPDLGAHSCDVADAATLAAERLGLSPCQVRQVRLAAELHDIGKLAIPARILCKPGPLDPSEWEIMRMHAEVGGRILSAAPGLAPIGALVQASHERHDGCGYPYGLRGEQIPLGARVIAVCDAYDAMTTQRVYNRPLAPARALERLRAAAGSQFDPQVVDVVCDAIQEMLAAPAHAPSERPIFAEQPTLVARPTFVARPTLVARPVFIDSPAPENIAASLTPVRSGTLLA